MFNPVVLRSVKGISRIFSMGDDEVDINDDGAITKSAKESVLETDGITSRISCVSKAWTGGERNRTVASRSSM